MRIALVVEHCHKRGGHERYVAELAERLSARHEVHLFANSFSDITAPVIHHHVPMLQKPSLAMMVSFMANSRRLIGRAGRFDIVHSQGPNSFVQNIVTNHTSQKVRIAAMKSSSSGRRSLFGRVHDRLYWDFIIHNENRIYNAKSGCRAIAVSAGVKREMLQYYKLPDDQIDVVVNGVDLARFSPGNRPRWRATWRTEMGIREEVFVLLFVGGDWGRKGLALAIEALSLLDQLPIQLAVVGQWHEQREFQQLADRLGIREKISFCGPTARPEEAYAGADAYLFPSSYEACSLSVLEAMASGLPVLMPAINGADEQMADGKNGWLIERDPRSIAQAVKTLVSDRRRRENMGAQSRTMAEQHSWECCVTATEMVYAKAGSSLW